MKYTYCGYKISWEDFGNLRHRWRITAYLGEIGHAMD